jgi:hypothetical protein
MEKTCLQARFTDVRFIMSRVGLFNMGFGFFVIFLSASAGTFLSYALTEEILREGLATTRWSSLLQRSAHGHFNLFGMIHILFGLSLVYSPLSPHWHWKQTIALVLGTLAMGPGLYLHSLNPPQHQISMFNILLGILVGAALVALLSHAVALFFRVMK